MILANVVLFVVSPIASFSPNTVALIVDFAYAFSLYYLIFVFYSPGSSFSSSWYRRLLTMDYCLGKGTRGYWNTRIWLVEALVKSHPPPSKTCRKSKTHDKLLSGPLTISKQNQTCLLALFYSPCCPFSSFLPFSLCSPTRQHSYSTYNNNQPG